MLLAEDVAGLYSDAPPSADVPAGKTFDAEPQPPQRRPGHSAAATDLGVTRPWRRALCMPAVGSRQSNFIEAVGHLSIDTGKTVSSHTLETLAALLRRHRADDSISNAISKLIGADLSVIDDVSSLAGLHRRRGRSIPSDRPPPNNAPRGDKLMPKSLATGTVDRLLHDAHVLSTDGTWTAVSPPRLRPESAPGNPPRCKSGMTVAQAPSRPCFRRTCRRRWKLMGDGEAVAPIEHRHPSRGRSWRTRN